MTLLLGLLPVAADPLAQSAPSHAPVVTRPVAADFPSETFTLFWRPPTLNTAAAVTAYRIYREQNADSRDHIRHPADCDNNPFARSLEIYAFTVSPRGTGQPGDTHGNCYRWKIAAANQNGPGPTATTQPILARGFVLNNTVFAYDDTRNNNAEPCPQDTSRPYAFNDNG